MEEGNGIAERTDNEITFHVESSPHDGGGFVHRCLLLVDKLGYRYPLMRVVQFGLDYPVKVAADVFPHDTAATDEAELRKVLGIVSQSDHVKKVVPSSRDGSVTMRKTQSGQWHILNPGP